MSHTAPGPVRYAMVRGTDADQSNSLRRIAAQLSVELPEGLFLVEAEVSAEELARLLPGRYVAVRVDPAQPNRAVRVVGVPRRAQLAGLVREKRRRGLLPGTGNLGKAVEATVREIHPDPEYVRADHTRVEFVLDPRSEPAYLTGTPDRGGVRAHGYYLPEQLVSYAPGTAVRWVPQREPFLVPDTELVALTAVSPSGQRRR
ncbi:hypothetical protein [Actinophytocola xinjiangensis]|uniref:hypothetical protein n=1 Tax=Actinophytocola xinjiangensis TaxID=485602 RepID=UPI000B129452|nr:hypothetical protein [Actinophytocola xinjiangensis]